nr:unnamed protein product [Callosobruchus chinensis]
MADLSSRDVERANFVFSIYDFEGNGTVDAVNLGDMLRALNLNPTLATIEKVGGTKKKNEKKLKIDEFLPIFSQVKKDKEQGNFDDFLECLKLYDKEENGTMMAAELAHTLLSLGKWVNIIYLCSRESNFTNFSPFYFLTLLNTESLNLISILTTTYSTLMAPYICISTCHHF